MARCLGGDMLDSILLMLFTGVAVVFLWLDLDEDDDDEYYGGD
jgi:hypothetical protein